jgi:hypothetical protein
MIEVHVFNAFLLPDLKQAGWFGILTFKNGLVAPEFLFVSGLFPGYLKAIIPHPFFSLKDWDTF